MNGMRLKQKRKEMGLSGEAIAKTLDTTRVTVSRWENGTSEPNDKKKIALAKMLHTSVAYLMGETDNPEPIPSGEPENVQKDIEQESVDYAYWGGVVNEVRKLLARGDEGEILAVAPLIKRAYEIIAQNFSFNGAPTFQMSVNGGHHNNNTQNVGTTQYERR